MDDVPGVVSRRVSVKETRVWGRLWVGRGSYPSDISVCRRKTVGMDGGKERTPV